MAEVYLGTHQGIGGFRKLVVMKRLLGWQRSNGEAIESLLDEARIAATINHPNIVTTLDIGLDRGSPYIVLEYLSGEDLGHLLQELHERDASIPLGIVCRIGASIASALSQAHELTLPDGTLRCIVHRDVTPSNIIVCYSGVTKLVDFGVARVSDDVPKTKAGMVKGKLSYLAPEQLMGAPLDGRTDVFQLGIVLWEMVTMRRLFDGKSDHERVNAVLNRPIRRPSELAPAVPTCLDRTIMRALDRDPTRRQQTARELEEELIEATAAIGVSGGDHSVAKWTQAAFAARHAWRIELERRTIAEASAEVPAGDYEVELQLEPDEAETPWSRRRIQTGPTVGTGAGITTGTSLRGIAVESSAVRPRSRASRYLIAVLVVMGAAAWWLRFYGPASGEGDNDAVAVTAPAAARPAEYDVDIRVVPANASIAIDGDVIANGRFRASFAADGAVHTVTFTAPDHTTVQRRFQAATTIEVSLERLTALAVSVSPPAADRTASGASEKQGTARAGNDARQRQRERVKGSSITSRRDPAPAASSTSPHATGSGSGAGSATLPARPKPPDDSFAPSSDNIDPFKTGT
jgi:serine/threonine-protein kinase